MEETLKLVRTYTKRTIAVVLFILLLLGASAAALAAFAAGVTALSGLNNHAFARTQDVVTVSSGAAVPRNQPSAQTPGSQDVGKTEYQGSVGTAQVVKGSHHETFINQLNNKLDHMHSPIGETLDSGGVALGQQVEQGFGRMMSGLLQTLFLEQPDASSASGRQP